MFGQARGAAVRAVVVGASLPPPARAKCSRDSRQDGGDTTHGKSAAPRSHFCNRLRPSLGRCTPPLYTRGVKIALGQINPTVGDFSGNASKIRDFSHRAKAAGAGMILFPELSVCGYPPRDLVERPS